MKYLILLSLLLVGCSNNVNCPKSPELLYNYHQRVTVINGFYKGSEGKVIDEYIVGYAFKCSSRIYQIELYREGHPVVSIPQEDLTLTRSE